MKYLSKASTKLKQELEKKITDVLESFAYDEIVSESGAYEEDCLSVERYYTKACGKIQATLLGSVGTLAVAEQMAIAVNAMLGLEFEDFTLRASNTELAQPIDFEGSLSELESIDTDDDGIDTLCAVFDTLLGYGIEERLLVADLHAEATDSKGVFFFCGLKSLPSLCEGKCLQNGVTITFDLEEIIRQKVKNAVLKEPVPVVLVASDISANCYKVAFGLRRQGLKTEGYVLNGGMYEAEEYCTLKGIATLIWADENKIIMKNIQSGETAETSYEKLFGKA